MVEKKADGEGYHKLVQSMESIGMSNDEKIELFRITAAILHLGNIQFEEESYGQKGKEKKVILYILYSVLFCVLHNVLM